MEVLVRTNDGFEISETDLRLRGPGQVLGTKQSGQNSFKFVAATYRKEYYDINLIAFKSDQKADSAEKLLREHLS